MGGTPSHHGFTKLVMDGLILDDFEVPRGLETLEILEWIQLDSERPFSLRDAIMFVFDHHATPGTCNPLANCARMAAWWDLVRLLTPKSRVEVWKTEAMQKVFELEYIWIRYTSV